MSEKQTAERREARNFIEEIIVDDVKNNVNDGRVHTRFPPEPNGFLHIGHAKSICLNFGLAEKFNGLCNLRFDDTNPEKEEKVYVDSIKEDVRWLGFDWDDREYYASDYFDRLYEFAVKLIKDGKAYVDDQSGEQVRATRGTPTEPGVESPCRDRSAEENLRLFEGMKNGKFNTGEKVLRARIDMSSPNMHLRDPVMYRIKIAPHHRTGSDWCIYPTYDWAHGQSDSIEGITHSLCTLEFEVHRPLYNWFIEQLGIFPSRQIEFARLNLSYTVLSKRKLLELVREGYVNGWDDPRMPTISGLRRRGFTPASIRNFSDRIGVAKRDGLVDVALLEFSVREDLNKHAQRRMAVLDPLKMIITNFPEEVEMVSAVNNPEDEKAGRRQIPFTRELYIDRGDFMVDPPKKFFRLAPGRVARLKYGYIVECTDYKTDNRGQITEIYCKYFPESRSGSDTSGIKVKSTLSWVSATHAVKAIVRLYDRLFTIENPTERENYKDYINTDSLQTMKNAMLEPSLAEARMGEHFQFERQGYFILDSESSGDQIIFNRTVTLRDEWAKLREKELR